MEWRDEGILLWVRRHGESNVIVEALTESHGRHAGLVRNGTSKSVAAVLQPGAQLSLEWNARLVEHLGTFKVDLIRARAGPIMSNREVLAALNTLSAMLVEFLPEREPNPKVYATSLDLVDSLAEHDRYWPVKFALWEMTLLESLGFGLDLTSCASTGQRDDLIYVSPRSGRAVCREAGAPFAEKMLPLPQFLINRGKPTMPDVREAMRMTGYFLESWVCPSYDIERLPDTRNRLLALMDKMDSRIWVRQIPDEDDREGEWDFG